MGYIRFAFGKGGNDDTLVGGDNDDAEFHDIIATNIPYVITDNTTIIELTKYEGRAYARMWMNTNMIMNINAAYDLSNFSGGDAGKLGGPTGTLNQRTYGSAGGTGYFTSSVWDNPNSPAKLMIFKSTQVVADGGGHDYNPTSHDHFIITDTNDISAVRQSIINLDPGDPPSYTSYPRYHRCVAGEHS